MIPVARANPRQRLWTGKALLPSLEMLLALAAAGLWYMAGEGMWGRAGNLGLWLVLLLIALWGLRWAAVGQRVECSAFSVPLILFVLSAAVGVWAAYDRRLAWAGLGSILSAVGIYWAMSHQPDVPHLYVALSMLGLLAPALTLYFLATNGWDQYPVKIPVLFDVKTALARFLPRLDSHPIHPNIVGGTLASLLPLYMPLVVLAQGGSIQGRWFPRVVRAGWVLCGCIGVLGLLLSVSRGAWAALGAVAGLWGVWRLLGQYALRRFSLPGVAWRWRMQRMAVLVVVGVALALLVMGVLLIGNLPGSGALRNRLSLLLDGMQLARDYGLIGTGPGTFAMQFSIYALLIHVGHTTHSHNLYMDLFLEQGALGLLSYLWLVAVAVGCALYWHRRATPAVAWLLEAGLAILGVQLFHGLVDDIQYGSRMFTALPFGLILALSRCVRSAKPDPQGNRRAIWRQGRTWVVGGVLLALLAAGCSWRPLLARFYANLGAVKQSQVELASYDPARFNERPLEAIRREENLDRAILFLARALQLDPVQVTARQRLAAISLARGEYAQAREHMEAVWGAGHRDSVTRLLLGDALVATGDVERAAQTVQGLTWAQSRLLGMGWGYYERECWPQANNAWQAVLMLDPGNEYAQYWSAEAKKRMAAN